MGFLFFSINGSFFNCYHWLLPEENYKMKIGTFFEGIKEGNKNFTKNISIIVNSALLSLVYFVGIGFTFLLAKIFNKKFLDTEIDRERDTYWKDLNLKSKPIEEYYRQF